jgi:hypothetical protein
MRLVIPQLFRERMHLQKVWMNKTRNHKNEKSPKWLVMKRAIKMGKMRTI